MATGAPDSTRTPCFYCGTEICLTAQAIYECARWLLDQGLAESDDQIETYRSDMRCMVGRVYDCAMWMVEETDKDGLRLRRYRPSRRDADTLPDEERLAA